MRRGEGRRERERETAAEEGSGVAGTLAQVLWDSWSSHKQPRRLHRVGDFARGGRGEVIVQGPRGEQRSAELAQCGHNVRQTNGT